MPANWYYAADGHARGPVGPNELRRLAAAGTLTPDTLVWREGSRGWVPAARVRGLFAPPPIPAPAPPPPVVPPAPARPNAAGFERLYSQVFQLSIPVCVFTVLLDFAPGVNVAAQLAGSILLVVLSSVFLHRAWSLVADGGARTTPGKAVGYRFIPFFCWYWEFVAINGLIEDLQAYARRRGLVVPTTSTELGTRCCVVGILWSTLGCVPVLGGAVCVAGTVLYLLVFRQIKDLARAVAAGEGRIEEAPGAVEGVAAAVRQGLGVAGHLLGSGDSAESGGEG